MHTINHEIRYGQKLDMHYVQKWLKDPEVIKWFSFEEGREELHALQGWESFNHVHATLTATVDSSPVGMAVLYLMPYQKVSHHCQFKVIVDPKFQHRGIGFSLIKNIKHLAKTYFKEEFILIEVMKGNPIVSLLKKHGFELTFSQERFFKVNGEYVAREMYMADLRNWKA